MSLVPQNRATIERLGGRPFVLIGVNSDKDENELTKRADKDKFSWRSFWDGEKSPCGPIATAWKIHTSPTLYLIDHRGVIRRQFIGSAIPEKDLNRLIDELVAEAKKPMRK